MATRDIATATTKVRDIATVTTEAKDIATATIEKDMSTLTDQAND